ncbi:restriction endonuclease [Chlorobaculum sp. 24CR]|uniref:restriction endonuclease n=1 Tax=Chlorobaculum sp. 24CR TaxID=2508878 RepID=UPI00100BB6CC|nr:restriction endonuclease [Chlorobaculum sp. 24CR]RXK85033.1 restriction endonuclease [Chlorobaculum sp. 24CR]
MIHPFTETILAVLENHFGDSAKTVFDLSPMLGYINQKTRSANRGSKSRSSFANLYALYVLIEDYIQQGFDKNSGYDKYPGADFTPLLKRIRELPFGQKLQNHALNNRANDEFHKYYPDDDRRPILRKVDLQKYWINESLLQVEVSGRRYNIAHSVLDIIREYAETKRQSFEQFITDCELLKKAPERQDDSLIVFIRSLIAPERDARLFEIVSYSVLRSFYAEDIIYIGSTAQSVSPERLRLYKTGRTNANDGGIDFVMKPLGRFFQVTETLDVKKYFLDIDKIERYPISFVVKTNMSISDIRDRLEAGAREQYAVDSVVRKYMDSIEEIINIPVLLSIFEEVVKSGHVHDVLDEIIRWSKIEFNYMDSNGSDPGSVADEDEDE